MTNKEKQQINELSKLIDKVKKIINEQNKIIELQKNYKTTNEIPLGINRGI